MNELIPITYQNDRPAVSARELHKFLEVGSNFTTWFERMKGYGFSPNEDFSVFWSDSKTGNAVNYLRSPQRMSACGCMMDASMSIDMAKELCMIQRTERGKEARQYFLSVEKSWNSPEKVMARALDIAHKTITALTSENAQQKQMLTEYSPKASYYDVVLQTPDAISASQIAKDYGKSAMWLNEYLHEKGIQFKQGGVWLLYQKYAEQGYTRSKTNTYSGNDGTQHSKLHTYWTQKGRLFIYDLLKSDEIFPLMEQAEDGKECQ